MRVSLFPSAAFRIRDWRDSGFEGLSRLMPPLGRLVFSASGPSPSIFPDTIVNGGSAPVDAVAG
jgi:hypothetical protein